MDPAFALLLAVPAALLVAGGVAWWSWRQRARWHEALQAAGDALSLRFVPGGWFGPARLEGEVEGLRVVVDTFQRSSGKSSVQFARIRVETGVPVRLVPEGFWTGLAEAVFGTDVPVGDPAFDDAVHLEGDPARISAIFGPHARSHVTGAVARGARHEQARWELVRRGTFRSADEIVAHVRALVAAGLAVRTPVTAAALLRRVAEDPEPGVRLRAAERLLDQLEARPDPAVADALVACVPPGIPTVRLAWLRDDADTLRAHLDHPDEAVAVFAATSLAGWSAPGADPALEARLRALLATGRLDVVGALGAIGTVASVPALHPLADRAFTTDGSHTAARAAIREIQSRVVGVGAGEVSLASGEGGGLAVAAGTTEGAVSEARTGSAADGGAPRRAAAARRAGTPEAR